MIVLLVLLPVYLSVLGYDFRQRVPVVYVPGWDYWFGALLLLSMVAGIQLALAQRHSVAAVPPPRISLTVMMWLLVPCVLAYAVWFAPVLSRPQLLLDIATGRRAELRDDISTVKGVTTFTQFGLAYVIAYALKAGSGLVPLRRIEHIGLALVFLLAFFRAFAWAERLAVIELVLCFAVARMAYLPVAAGWRWKVACTVPALAPFALYGLFTASEYFRTWEFYANQYSSVWAMSMDRLISYYATAVNNGVGVLVETPGWPFYSGAFVLESLWLMPGLGTLLDAAFGNDRYVEPLWLKEFGRPEFNSPTAYFRTVLDLGYFGSVLYYTAFGYLVGRAYAGFQRGQVFGLLMYGVFVLHLAESLRYGYIGETRFVPLALGLTLVALDIHRMRARP
jgi:oligosaccharide repeat unit polymerase